MRNRVVVLSENTANSSSGLDAEHGLSIYIEANNIKYLVDCGQSDIFLKNAIKLDIEICEVDYLIITHAHCDHGGGIEHFIKNNSKAKIYIHSESKYLKTYSKKRNYKEIGLTNLDNYTDRITYIDKDIIGEDFQIVSIKKCKHPTPRGNNALFVHDKNGYVLDNFEHEIVLSISIGDRNIVVSGCCHKGILNYIDHFNNKMKKVDLIVGGFHLLSPNKNFKVENEDELAQIGEQMLKYNEKAQYYTGHCTSKYAFDNLQKKLRGNIFRIETGTTIEL